MEEELTRQRETRQQRIETLKNKYSTALLHQPSESLSSKRSERCLSITEAEAAVLYNPKRPRYLSADDDMFAESNSENSMVPNQTLDKNIEDVDDASGYYIFRAGEEMAGKYKVQGQKGRGVFSNVAFATVGDTSTVVALKVLRNNETMRRAGNKEELLLQEIRQCLVPSFVVDFLESFEHHQHLVLVFEAMHMNLRQILYRYGRNIGINILGVQRYGQQLFKGLDCLEKLNIVHADLKLDNILVSQDLQTVKLCDFGCAFRLDDHTRESTAYLVSRFYRAPEIILGLSKENIGCAIDTWALGTCLFELFAGTVLFPGRSNNEMIKFIMRSKGKVPNRILKKHCDSYINVFRKEPHFEPKSFAFREILYDEQGQPGVKVHQVVSDAKHNLSSKLERRQSNSLDDTRLVPHLAKLLESTLAIDPSHRISVKDALASPFFSE